ncbi:Kinesin-like protein [Phytophthora cinnamomi]|uniref:Kinesin-like protein n=1 Tax=Phytophthora cinnamomi TaxID=4785 RepID=UPI0035595640|nr:Kinesin-like protein [Phytophthora cinnamomi]
MPETTSPSLPESKSQIAAPPVVRRGGSSENIQVFIRIRPLIERENSQERCAGTHSIRATDHQTIEVRTSESTIKCAYDAVFDHTFSQEQVYDRVRECTQSFLQGFNSTLFAYGQTGSGKSFTMFGAETDLSRYRPGLQNSQAGIIPRAIKEIFAATVQMEADAQATVFCSFVQIYNEQIFDLLRDTQMNAPLEIHEDRKNGIFVEGLSEYAVRSVSDCLQLLQCGEQNRAVRSTHMNQKNFRKNLSSCAKLFVYFDFRTAQTEMILTMMGITHFENTVRQLKDASDRFFRFEIEEEELKAIHSRLFQGFQGGASNPPLPVSRSPLSTGGRTLGGGNIMKPRPRRSSSIDANGNGECWKNDIQAAPPITVEKELELSRKAIEKQTKLQNWLIEKERREILKLQQEQQFVDEQRRYAAEKDAKFFKRAAATKKKLLLATAASASEALDSPSSKPATAET